MSTISIKPDNTLPPVEPPDPAKSIQETVDRLTKEIAALRATNTELQAQLERLSAPVRSPDELASALQRTVDKLQSDLGSLANPVANFAIKDFRLETALTVGITDLGTIEYRLVAPGANVDPNTLSKLTVSLVPIEKQGAQGTLAPMFFDAEKEVSQLGASEDLQKVLQNNHIFTIGDFRNAVSRARVRTLLVSSTRTTLQELALLQARAELLMLTGLDRVAADTLIAAKVDGLQALARSTPEALQAALKNVSAAQIEQWVSAARAFTGIEKADPPPPPPRRRAVVPPANK